MPHRRHLTLVTFGFKFGSPNTNYYFDVSFLKNPAREERWGLFAQPGAEMRDFVLEQPLCQAFLEVAVPLIHTLLECDDDVRIGLGCSSGRHRSYIVAEEIKRRMQSEETQVRLIHREESYA
ncbi:MAG TPA: RNase adapter RapZ [Planctomycetota bacterium]|nr:RNase adapter RapZ [Planctomycetota bacterium]